MPATAVAGAVVTIGWMTVGAADGEAVGVGADVGSGGAAVGCAGTVVGVSMGVAGAAHALSHGASPFAIQYKAPCPPFVTHMFTAYAIGCLIIVAIINRANSFWRVARFREVSSRPIGCWGT